MGEWLQYYATVCAGLESVAEEEIHERFLGARNVTTDYGKVLFEYSEAPADLFALRSVNNLFLFAGQWDEVPPAREALDLMMRWVRGLPLASLAPEVLAAAGAQGLAPLHSLPKFRVTAVRSGTHEYTSQEIAAALGQGIVDEHGWPVDLTHFDLEVLAHLADQRLTVGLRLTPESLHRRNRVVHGRASLKASIAYALVWLARPKAGEVLIDPLCGTGTIPIEAVLGWPGICAVGGDLHPSALCAAQQNAAHAGAACSILRWDARRLPLADRSVHAVVSDLPFGRRIGSHRYNRHLYPGVIRECARVLAPGGRAVLLTLERRLMHSILRRERRLDLVRIRPVNISNLRAAVYELERS